ncbi:IS630 family transposase [Nostoc sp.]
MAGRQKTYSVQLTEDEKKLLQQQANARKTGQSKVKRAKIILTTAENLDWTDAQIAQNIGCSQALVRKWRKRWCQTRSLEEAPRSGRPRIFEAIIRAKVTAIACSKATDFDLPLARWSCSDIASHLVTLGIVVSIATSTVWRWLKSERIKPWRFHAWMHRIDDNFVAKATPVLKLYAQAKFLIKAGFWVVCVDEKTSIQAREGLHPNKGAGVKQPVHFAARYARIGATHLFAALSVADGLIYGCCRPTKTFLDFQAFLLEVLIPEAIRRGVRHLYLILDNGSTHAPKQLQAWLNQKQKEDGWNFTVEVVWLPKYASWLDQIEIWFSILQRKLLTPNDFPDLETLQQRITDFIVRHNDSAQPIKWSYTVAQMTEKFATN